MTDWMWMTKPGLQPAQVTRESFEMCHAPNGWVEYTPPPPEPVEATDQDSESAEPAETETPTTTRTSRRAAATEEK